MTVVYQTEPEARNLYYVIPAEVMDSDLPMGHKILYALLSGYAHKNGECYPSDEHIGKRIGCSTKTAGKWIGDLAKKGYISKRLIPHPSNPFKKIRIITITTEFKKSLRTPPSEDSVTPAREHSGIPASEEEVSKGYSNKKKTSKDVLQKTRFIDHVFLTSEEHQKLLDEYGEKKIKEMIKRLDAYIGSKGRKYNSHYKTILTWIMKDEKENSRMVTKTADPNKKGKGVRN